MEYKKRIEWLDAIKFICMIFIMMGHFEFFPQKIETFFSAFCLTGFLLCTGYTFHLEKNVGFFIKKRIKQILLPMLWMGALVILSRTILTFNIHNSITEEVINFFMQIRGKGDELWFLALLFGSELLFYLIVLICKKPIKILGVSLILCIIDYIYYLQGGVALPWHIQMYGAACLFLASGYALKMNFEKIKNIFNKINTLIAFILYVIIWIIYVIYLKNPSVTFYSFGSNIVLYFVFNYLGLFMIVGFSMLVKLPKICYKIGQNTLIFYGLHGKLESLYESIVGNFISNNIYIQTFHSILGTIIISIILLVISHIVNKYFPFLLGRKRIENKNISNNEI